MDMSLDRHFVDDEKGRTQEMRMKQTQERKKELEYWHGALDNKLLLLSRKTRCTLSISGTTLFANEGSVSPSSRHNQPFFYI